MAYPSQSICHSRSVGANGHAKSEDADETVTQEASQVTKNGEEENALDQVKADAGEAGKTTQV